MKRSDIKKFILRILYEDSGGMNLPHLATYVAKELHNDEYFSDGEYFSALDNFTDIINEMDEVKTFEYYWRYKTKVFVGLI